MGPSRGMSRCYLSIRITISISTDPELPSLALDKALMAHIAAH
jgi:hypothetical protein